MGTRTIPVNHSASQLICDSSACDWPPICSELCTIIKIRQCVQKFVEMLTSENENKLTSVKIKSKARAQLRVVTSASDVYMCSGRCIERHE
jgi:hypothetical protein